MEGYTMAKVAQAEDLRALKEGYRTLRKQLTSVGFISSGSLVRRYMPCGKLGCRCQGDPRQLHGPYWQWTRKVRTKTVTRRLTAEQANLYRQWIDNRRRMAEIISEMEEISQRAAELLVDTGGLGSPSRGRPDGGRSR
ncbi:MAG: DUF6788 family protein [Actinomycetota bacterium]